MVAAISTQITTPNGTHLTSKESEVKDIPTLVSTAMAMLYRAHKSAEDAGPESLEAAADEVCRFFRENNVDTKNKILDGFKAVRGGIPKDARHPKYETYKSTTHLCGWLLGFSGVIEDRDWWAIAAGLDQRYNPWPSLIATRPQAVEVSRPLKENPGPDPEQSYGAPYDRINTSPKGFMENMGEVQGQHFLVVEDLVNGGPAILNIIAGCLKSSIHRLEGQRRPERPEITVVDLTGKPYLGLEKQGKVFYSSVCPKRHSNEPLTEEESWHVPIMEGVWQAYKSLKDRLLTRKLSDHNVEFPPHFLVLRRWDAILDGWTDLNEAKRNSLREAWRRTYDHPDDQSIDVAKAVKEILTLGDDVSVTIVMSITCFGSVDDVGVSKNKLNSFLIVIPGIQGPANGGKAVDSALTDSRLQFITQENRAELKLAVEQGQKFSRETGSQYCLVNLSGHTKNAMIMTIPTATFERGARIPIELARPDYLNKLKPSPLLNG